MNEKHYQEELSAFVNHELPAHERQLVAEHLLVCADCRAAHDDIRFAAGLAASISQSDAPITVWNEIETALNAGETTTQTGFGFFNFRSLAAALLLIAVGIAVFVQFGRSNSNDKAADKKENLLPEKTEKTPEIAVAPSVKPLETPVPSASVVPQSVPPTPVENELVSLPSEKEVRQPVIKPNPTARAVPERKKAPDTAWNVETIAGQPQIGDSLATKLKVGELLETDENSRARVTVADIGNVEIAPNSRVQLVATKPTEHRLSLERGTLRAQIFAPPRLFIVDTPTATAVDLGCEYTLEVDENGDSRLHVTGGFVALENGDYESIVPAGASALTRKGKGIGTPFADKATEKLKKAVYKFDFNDGGAGALDEIIAEASRADSLTLWHLLARVTDAERGKVFDALSERVKPPAKVTRDGVLKLDRKMLERWWAEVENVWFDDPDNR